MARWEYDEERCREVCSECDDIILEISEEPFHSMYCPHCGEKMENFDERYYQQS